MYLPLNICSMFIIVPTTQVQSTAGDERKGRESSSNENTRTSTSGYSGEERLDNHLVGTVHHIVQENI